MYRPPRPVCRCHSDPDRDRRTLGDCSIRMGAVCPDTGMHQRRKGLSCRPCPQGTRHRRPETGSGRRRSARQHRCKLRCPDPSRRSNPRDNRRDIRARGLARTAAARPDIRIVVRRSDLAGTQFPPDSHRCIRERVPLRRGGLHREDPHRPVSLRRRIRPGRRPTSEGRCARDNGSACCTLPRVPIGTRNPSWIREVCS